MGEAEDVTCPTCGTVHPSRYYLRPGNRCATCAPWNDPPAAESTFSAYPPLANLRLLEVVANVLTIVAAVIAVVGGIVGVVLLLLGNVAVALGLWLGSAVEALGLVAIAHIIRLLLLLERRTRVLETSA